MSQLQEEIKAIYSLSMQFNKDRKTEYLEQMLKISLFSKDMCLFDKYYLFQFCFAAHFLFNTSEKLSFNSVIYEVLKKITDDFLIERDIVLHKIPKKERNKKFILVITPQFIHLKHSPTLVAANMCKDLQEKLGCKVKLINTAELGLIKRKDVCLYERYDLEYNKVLTDARTIQIEENFSIDFCQFKDLERDYIIALDKIYQEKPYMVIYLGNISLFASLVNKIVPVLSLNLEENRIPINNTEFLVMRNKKHSYQERKYLKNIGLNLNNLIDNFGFEYDSDSLGLEAERDDYNRKEFGLPEDKFILLLAGNRLDQDIKSADNGFFRKNSKK